jgi:ATP-binding cassette subfamily F protein uup
MANLVSLDSVSKRHAEKLVLDEVTFGLDERDHAGVIGLNGSGKSTLLALVAGVLEPDSGRVVLASGARVAYLPQDPPLPLAASALDAVRATGVEPYEAEATLDRLGVNDVAQPVGAMSGGQRKRVALARALVQPAELLIVDEPTNHLDVDAIDWLERHLRSRTGAVLLVTHDRYLLDRVATRVVEVERGRLFSHGGSYADYLDARALRVAQAEASERRRQNRLRTELAWLRRGAQARTSKARYRVEQAQALLEAEPEAQRAQVAIELPPGRRLGGKVVHLHEAGKRYDDRWVVRDVDHKLGPGDRVGIVGPNGSGKTTLLGLLAGRLVPDAGSVTLGDTVAVGWYTQMPSPLPPTQRVLAAVQEVVLETKLTDGVTVSTSQLLERFLFDAAAQQAYVGELSGGERRRLELLLVLARAPNVLLLDEPTNDLDLDTLGVLEEYLDAWPGTLVVATHDRFFLDRVCDDVYSVEPDGRLRHHPGGWRAYREHHDEQQRASEQTPRDPAAHPKPQQRARKLGFNESRELAELERRIPALEQRRAELTAALEAAVDDYEAAQRTGEELAALLAELDAAEERWLELSAVAEGA